LTFFSSQRFGASTSLLCARSLVVFEATRISQPAWQIFLACP
jgi:hypothetical protein